MFYNNSYPYPVQNMGYQNSYPQSVTTQQQVNLPQLQQNILPAQPTGLYGRIVQTVDNITVNDVPMDGSIAVFPKSDYTEIYAKTWNARNGRIETCVYRPVREEAEKKEENGVTLQMIFDDVQMLKQELLEKKNTVRQIQQKQAKVEEGK